MNSRLALIALDITLVSFWSAIICIFFVAANTHSPLSFSRMRQLSVLSVGPEGWGFFTRDPQEPRLLLFSRTKSGALVDANPATVRTWYEVLGGSRSSRIRGMEVAKIHALVPADAWTQCRADVQSCVPERTLQLVNPMFVRTVCGEHVLQVQVPVPWAWSARHADVHMRSKVVRMNVSCNGGTT